MLLAGAAFAWNAPQLPSQQLGGAQTNHVDRRALLAGAFAGAIGAVTPTSANALVESSNPAGNYYFPMAKYRYLPRIFRTWVAVDQLAPAALEVGDWEGLEEVWKRADDAVTALPLYTNAVDGSRSGKRKKKSALQKSMIVDLKGYSTALDDFKVAVAKKNTQKAQASLAAARK